MSLTSIAPNRQSAALIGRLYGEAKVSATKLEVEDICSDDGVQILLTHLDRSYGIDEHNQLNVDISAFMNYSWISTYSVDQFISGYNSRFDRVSCLGFDEYVKVNLLLKLSGLSQSDQNIVFGSAGGDYSVTKISTALHNAFQRMDPSTHSMHSSSHAGQPRSVLTKNPRLPHWHDRVHASDTSSMDARGGNHSFLGHETSGGDRDPPGTTHGSGEYRPRRGREPPKKYNEPKCMPTFYTVCASSCEPQIPKVHPVLPPRDLSGHLSASNSGSPRESVDGSSLSDRFAEVEPMRSNALKHPALPPLFSESPAGACYPSVPEGESTDQRPRPYVKPSGKRCKVTAGKRTWEKRVCETSTKVLRQIVNRDLFAQSDVDRAFLRGLHENGNDEK